MNHRVLSSHRENTISTEDPIQDNTSWMIQGANVSFVDVRKSYGDFEAIRDFNLEIGAGEFLTILGPSGSGKTTSLMLLAGFQAPTRGTILINGMNVTSVPAYRRDQGVVFQSYSLFPHMTIEKNLAFPLQTRGRSKDFIAERVTEALKMVRLDGLGDRYPDQLSGGQQQRVALARAVVAEPPLLLMDEPLGALDKKLREEMQLEIKHIQKSLKVTVLYVTHDQDEALTMSDRIVVMNGGEIVQVGQPSELYERPKGKFVAQFIGDTNIVSGHLEHSEKPRHFVSADGDIKMLCAEDWARGRVGAVTAAIRPEKIAMHLPESIPVKNLSLHNANTSGIIVEKIYVGQMTKYIVKCNGESTFLTKAISDSENQVFDIGQKVLLTWSLQDFVVLED